MKIGYVQKDEATATWIGNDPGMVGIARKRPDDRWSPVVGLAVALLKAEFGGPTGQDRDAFMLIPFTDDIKKLELSDSQTLIWADMRHGLRMALKAVENKRELRYFGGIRPLNDIPSDGQLCEGFALRFISEADLKIE